MRRLTAGLAVLAFTSGIAVGQSHQPYAGLQTRQVKALSEQQIADLKSGRGMGLALAAELNGYPGPLHVLELADRIGLTGEQRAEAQRLFDAMKAEATSLGEKLIAEEAALDRLFESRAVTPVSLEAATAAIGATQAALRNTHLKYHLSTAAILSPPQMQHYAQLRGYGSTHSPQHHHRRGH